MEKYLLLFGVFLVTWQIQSAAGFPGRFKNSSTSQEGDTGKNAPTIGDASPEGNSSKESTTDESTTKETTTTVTTTEETTTKTVPDPPPNPVGPFSCNDLKSTDGKDHKFDILRCNSLKSSEKDMMLKPTISNDFDINLFNKFADNLKSIDGVGLELGKTELKKIDIVKLQNFANSKGLKMESNGNLQYLDIRVANPLSKFGDLSVQLNDALVSFLLVPEGGEICGSIEFLKNDMLAVIYVNVTKIDAPIKIPAQPSKLIFSDNPSLETIYLMNLKEIKNVKEWKIVNNALGKMATSRLTNIIGMDRFEVSGNKGLKSLYFPELIHVDVREIIISNNANLKSIIINNPKLTFSENTTIVIRQNHKLTHIHIMVVKLHTIRFEIRGNPSLNVTWLNRLRHDYQGSCEHAGNSCIQRDGECILDKEIQDLSEITDCKYVCGNLTLAENVTGEFDASIDLVDGDIHFANYPWWSIKGTEGKGVLDKKGRVYSNRCDAVGYGGEVIIVGNCETEPPPIETVENITTTTTTRAPQMPETFRPEDYVLEENMKEPATATQSSWLSQSDITAIILVIILGSFFAMLIYLYHCRSDENRQRGALTDGLTRIEDNSLAEIEISAAEMAEPPSKERPKLPPSMSTTSNSAGGIPSTGRSPMPEAVNPANPPVNPSQPNINNST